MTDIESLRALHEAATPGPWEVLEDGNGRKVFDAGLWSEEAGHYSVESMAFGNPEFRADAALITAMRNALPDLLDELGRLRRQVQRVEALADRGVGTDLNPTINLAVTDTAWWYSYLRGLDENWRHHLRAAIGGDDE